MYQLFYKNYLFFLPIKLEPVMISQSLTPVFIKTQIYLEILSRVSKLDVFMKSLLTEKSKIVKFFRENCMNDKFVKILMNIIDEAEKRNPPTKPKCLLLRYDYMFDKNLKMFLQTEFNLIAVGAGFNQTSTNNYIKSVYNQVFNKDIPILTSNYDKKNVETFIQGYKAYGNDQAYLVDLRFEGSSNFVEFLMAEELLIKNEVKNFFINTNDIKKERYHVDEDKIFFYNGKEIGLILLRALYDPFHYTPEIIEFCIALESSKCIVVPEFSTLLSSLKPIQYLMFNEKLLKMYDI